MSRALPPLQLPTTLRQIPQPARSTTTSPSKGTLDCSLEPGEGITGLHRVLCCWGKDRDTGHRGPFPLYVGTLQQAYNEAVLDYEFWSEQDDGTAGVVIYGRVLETLWTQIEDLVTLPNPYAGATSADEYISLETGRTIKLVTDNDRLDFAALKARHDIVEYVSRHTTLRKAGRTLKARCPLPGHDEKTPSFYVYPANQSWFCFGACHKGGDIFDFWKAMHPDTPYPDELTGR